MDVGYEPGENTNDNWESITKVTMKDDAVWGEEIILDTPSRFGYTFQGWKVLKGENLGETSYQNQYTLRLEDAVAADNKTNGDETADADYTIHLVAQWTEKGFPLRFYVTGVEIEYVKVVVGATEYASVAAFAEACPNITWDASSGLLTFTDFINYGENILEYVNREMETEVTELPKLVDTRTGESKMDFTGWVTPGGTLTASDMTYSLDQSWIIEEVIH